MSTSSAAAIHSDAIVLVGFGGPETREEIRPFLDRVLDGRLIPQSRFDEVVDHYFAIGGKSPYNELTQRQADAVARMLKTFGIDIPVKVAFRNTAPFVENVIDGLAQDHVKDVACIVLAPHQCSASWDKYVVAVEEARHFIGSTAPQAHYIRPYFDHRLFVRAHAERVNDALASLGRSNFDDTELIFTAHSIPLSTPGADLYVGQFMRSAQLIAQAVDARRWCIGYQSRSGSPRESWLEPGIRDVLRGLAVRGVREAVIAPIGFLCDHVEVLYDLDIDAESVAREAGVRIERAAALNDHPLFVQMLVELAVDQLMTCA